MTVKVVFDQAALKALANSAAVEKPLVEVSNDVVGRVNEADARVLNPGEKGGVGSFTSTVQRDEDGVYTALGYPEENFYMWFHQFGTEHEKPRPTVLPALFTPTRSTHE